MRKRIYLCILGIGSLILLLLLWAALAQKPPIALPQLTTARFVHIEEDWAGYNDLAPVLAHFDLVSFSDGFRGTGFFSMAGKSGPSGRPSVTDTVEITVPISAMHSLMNTLQQVRPQEGPYPTPWCCDYYPSLKIELQLPTAKVVFFSTSTSGDLILTPAGGANNGDPWVGLSGHVPWGLILRDKTYIVNSPLPAQALATIDGYLRKDVWDKLTEEFNSKYIPPKHP